jgi:hypothetical protein
MTWARVGLGSRLTENYQPGKSGQTVFWEPIATLAKVHVDQKAQNSFFNEKMDNPTLRRGCHR